MTVYKVTNGFYLYIIDKFFSCDTQLLYVSHLHLKSRIFSLRMFLQFSTVVIVLQSINLWSFLLQYIEAFDYQSSRLFW